MQKVLYNFIARQAHYCVRVIILAKGRCCGEAQAREAQLEKRVCLCTFLDFKAQIFSLPFLPGFDFCDLCPSVFFLNIYITLLNFLNKNTISGFLDVRTMTK